ncbi:hypothetical protein M427DRAFT_35418 [Gonapodya prolifera JEL478]|uniref:Uncharacterized protein n=1 Tax=Gonapodya prolifera (strain JEL478) TaxID=1344416 RepID=A0A139A5T5_GONPJ|nr:hypothetical protein M427DRAFT_35418 [Gonapodya prolifera JEL478]|eukprot:KXS11845.1 hypothetical protein M427DRAFT_35418 [Gonapodya prolifera JEL478]
MPPKTRSKGAREKPDQNRDALAKRRKRPRQVPTDSVPPTSVDMIERNGQTRTEASSSALSGRTTQSSNLSSPLKDDEQTLTQGRRVRQRTGHHTPRKATDVDKEELERAAQELAVPEEIAVELLE